MQQFVQCNLDYLKYLAHKFIVEVNPKWEINRYFKKVFGHKANLVNPQSLIEKIYWMQLHCDTSSWSLFADKYRVRKYIEDKGYGDYLPKLYGVWDNPYDMNVDELPTKCVIKTNNGCGSIFVVKDKSYVEWLNVRKKLNHWMKIPFGYSGFEPHYLSIKPCVLAEELLIQNKELKEISPASMVDYKFWCFNGHVESCFVTYGRAKGNLFIDLYDMQWNRLRSCLKNYGMEKINDNISIPKPVCLDKMIEIASNLSKGQPQIRVDMYLVGDKPVVGELTMSSGYGYFTEEYYNHLGKLVDVLLLPQKR